MCSGCLGQSALQENSWRFVCPSVFLGTPPQLGPQRVCHLAAERADTGRGMELPGAPKAPGKTPQGDAGGEAQGAERGWGTPNSPLWQRKGGGKAGQGRGLPRARKEVSGSRAPALPTTSCQGMEKSQGASCQGHAVPCSHSRTACAPQAPLSCPACAKGSCQPLHPKKMGSMWLFRESQGTPSPGSTQDTEGMVPTLTSGPQQELEDFSKAVPRPGPPQGCHGGSAREENLAVGIRIGGCGNFLEGRNQAQDEQRD